MTAARRLPDVPCAVGAEPLDPRLCSVEPVSPECEQAGANRPPDAVDDEVSTRPGRMVRGNVLGNEVDLDGGGRG